MMIFQVLCPETLTGVISLNLFFKYPDLSHISTIWKERATAPGTVLLERRVAMGWLGCQRGEWYLTRLPSLAPYSSQIEPCMGVGQSGTVRGGGEPAEGVLPLLLCPWVPHWLGPQLPDLGYLLFLEQKLVGEQV